MQTYTIHPNLVCIPVAKLFFARTFAMITGMGATSVTKNKTLTKILDFFYKFSFYFCDHVIYVNEQNEKYLLITSKLSLKVLEFMVLALISKKNII